LVIEPDNVVFAEVGAALHFDEFQRRFARISEAMPGAYGDVGRLVFAQNGDLLPYGDLSGAANDDPLLRSVLMTLKRQARTRIDDDVLNLESGPAGDRLE